MRPAPLFSPSLEAGCVILALNTFSSLCFLRPVLEFMQLPDARECENKLVVLLEYDKFDFIKLLMRNRAKIVYCTRLKQAQTEEERKAIEEEMRNDVVGGGPAILADLHKTESAESWMQDRIGKPERMQNLPVCDCDLPGGRTNPVRSIEKN